MIEAFGADRLRFSHPDIDGALELPYERATETAPDALLEGIAYLLAAGASPHHEALVLRLQGPELAALLVRRDWLAAFPGEEPVPSVPLGDTDLAAVYRLTSRPGVHFLSARCLDQTGITATDLHDAIEAMLRQSLDETAIRRTAESGELTVLEDDEERAAAYLFVLPDELGGSASGAERPASGEELLAAVASAGCVALGPCGAERELERWLDDRVQADAADLVPGTTPLAPRLLRITPSGVQTVSPSADGRRDAR